MVTIAQAVAAVRAKNAAKSAAKAAGTTAVAPNSPQALAAQIQAAQAPVSATPSTPVQTQGGTPPAQGGQAAPQTVTQTTTTPQGTQVAANSPQALANAMGGQTATPPKTTPATSLDFQDNSDKRLKEIALNLDKYRKSSPDLFTNQETFRNAFSYNDRSAQQKAVLDANFASAQKEAATKATAMGQQNAIQQQQQAQQQIATDMSIMSVDTMVESGLSDAQKKVLQATDPAKYAEYQQKLDEKIMLDTINGEGSSKNPFEAKILELMTKSSEVPDFAKEYNAKLDELKPQQTELADKKAELMQIEDEMDGILNDTRKELEGTGATDSYIRALASKRMEEITPVYKAKIRDYNVSLEAYQSSLSNLETQFKLEKDQYTMEQQAQQQDMSKLGFAMQLMDYQTPKQKEEAAWNMFVKQQTFAEGDINSKDPVMKARAIKSAVESTLKEFAGIPMKRSSQQMVQDITALVKGGMSLGEAITKNIREPIMQKPEYKNYIKQKFGTDDKKTVVSINGKNYRSDEQGNLTNIVTPDDLNVKANGLTGSQASSVILGGGVSAIADQMELGKTYNCGTRGQCGEWYNDAVGRANGTAVGDSYASKTKFVDPKIMQGEAGMGVVYNFGGQYQNEGHIGVLASGVYTRNGVRGYDVISANAKGNEKLSKDFVSEGLIVGSRGGFIPTQMQQQQAGYSSTQQNIMKSMDAKNLSKLDLNTLASNGLKDTDLYNYKAQQNAMGQGPEAIKEITTLRKEFNALPEVKTYRTVKSNYDTVVSQASNPTPAGDLSLIFSYMKLLDPNSTVREGEFANAQNAGSIDDKVRNMYNKVKKGTRLTDTQRKDFVASAGKAYKPYLDTYNSRLGEYQSYITAGGDPTSIGLAYEDTTQQSTQPINWGALFQTPSRQYSNNSSSSYATLP